MELRDRESDFIAYSKIEREHDRRRLNKAFGSADGLLVDQAENQDG
jgi:hypothetical protein